MKCLFDPKKTSRAKDGLVLWSLIFLSGWQVGGVAVSAMAGGLMNVEDSWVISSFMTRGLISGCETNGEQQKYFMGSLSSGNLYGLPELNQKSISLESGVFPWGKKLTMNGSWQKTGKDLFVENRLMAKAMVGQFPGLGFAVRRVTMSLGQQAQIPSLDIFLLCKIPIKWGDFAGQVKMQWPGYSSSKKHTNYRHGRRTEVLKATVSRSDHAFAVVVDRLVNGTPQFGFQILVTLAKGVGLEFRVDSPTGSLGPGVSVVWGGLMLRSSHLIHSKLGITHRLALVVGRFGGE